MADISSITIPSGTYNFKDTVARNAAAGGIQLKGTTTTALTDESTTNPITINGEPYTAVNQDAVFYGSKEFVFDGTYWHEFGDMTGLGSLATQNSASGSYTPAGTVSQPSFTGSSTTLTGSFTPEGTCSGTAVELATTTVTPISAVGTLPTLTTTVVDENLTISFSQGTLPTAGSAVTVATGTVTSVTQPTFTGTAGTVSVSGTPEGTVSQPTFTGSAATITVS